MKKTVRTILLVILAFAMCMFFACKNDKSEKYAVTVNACEGVTVECGSEIEKGADLSFGVKLNDGYEGELTVSATVGGEESDVKKADSGYFIEKVNGDVVISVVGAEKAKSVFSVTLNKCDGVIVSGLAETVKKNEMLSFSVAIVAGYEGSPVITATMGGKTAEVADGIGNFFTINNIDGDVVVTVTGVTKRSKIAVDFRSDNENVVLPENAKVEKGDSLTFQVKPAEGFKFVGEITVKANDVAVSVGADGKYEIKNITEYQDVEIIAETEEIRYALTYTADVAEGLGEQSTTYYSFTAAEVKFSVALTADYNKSPIKVYYSYGDVAETLLTADESGYYSFANVKSDVAIRVEGLTLNVYTVSFYLGEEKKYEVSVVVRGRLTEEQLVEAQAKVVEGTEYKFSSWDGDVGAAITSDMRFTAKTVWGDKINSAFVREEKKKVTVSADAENVPDGYETALKYVWDDGEQFNANCFSALNIAKYDKIKLKIKSNYFTLFSDDDSSWKILSDWADVTIVKTDAAQYELTITFEDWTYTRPVKNETLAGVFKGFSSSKPDVVESGCTLWTTEMRGVIDKDYSAAPVQGDLLGCPLRENKNLGKTDDVVAPMGYNSVYKAKDPDMAAIDIAKYDEVHMGIMMNGYYLFKSDWSKLVDLRGVWMEIKCVKNGTGWNVTVSDLYNGSVVIYSMTADSDSFNEIVSWAFSLASDEKEQMLFVTELRGEKDNSYRMLDVSLIAGGVKDESATVPVGYNTVYAYTHQTGTADHHFVGIPFADISLDGYDSVSFSVMSDQELFFDGWGVYINRGTWTEITLTKVDGGWKISSTAKLEGGNAATWLASVHTGNTIAEVFPKWKLNEKYVGEGQGHFYTTELIIHTAAV